MIATAILAALAGFVAGFVVGVVVTRLLDARPPQRSAQRREADPKFFDPYCNRTFTDETEAREHAIERHNAPVDGDAWKGTFVRPDPPTP